MKIYNAQATEKLKNLAIIRKAFVSRFDTNNSDRIEKEEAQWEKVRSEDVEQLVKRGADIYTTMPDGSRWLDNIIIIGNIPVLNTLIDINAVDINDKKNIAKTCWLLIENHKRGCLDIDDFHVYARALGVIDNQEYVHMMIDKMQKDCFCDETEVRDFEKEKGKVDIWCDYQAIFQKLFKKGLNPNKKIGMYESLFAMCDERIDGIKKGKYWREDNPYSTGELKQFFSTYKNYTPPVRRDRHKPKGLKKAKTEQQIQQKQ